MRSVALAVIGLSIVGCTAINSRDFAPAGQWATSKTLDEATACVVQALDAAQPSVNHAAVIKVPGHQYEVKPTRDLMVGGEPYVVRLVKAESGTQITLYAIGVFASQNAPYVARCSG